MRTPNNDMNTGLKKGSWSHEEDNMLISYISRYGIWNWSQMPRFAGLSRSGKSCRLRWMNYLKPNIKRGNFSKEEEDIIIHTHSVLGNKWSAIASKLPGRTDNEVKNHWHAHLKKRLTHYDPEITAQNGEKNSPIFKPKSVEKMEPADSYNKNNILESSLTSDEDIISCTSSAFKDQEVNFRANYYDKNASLNFKHNTVEKMLESLASDEDIISSTSSASNDQEVNFRADYYDIGSPGTVDDLQCFWQQLRPFENLEHGNNNSDMFSNSIFQCSCNDPKRTCSYMSNEYDIFQVYSLNAMHPNL